MQLYVKLIDGVPVDYSISELKKDNPQTSFPAELGDTLLASFDVYPVTTAPRPDASEVLSVKRQFASLVDGAWVYGWDVIAIPPSAQTVKIERDRRLQLDFEFGGKMYQRDTVSLSRIAGRATLAGFAVAAGAVVGDVLWHGEDTPFMWIASDDTLTVMDAHKMFAFGKAAANEETKIVFAAKLLRGMDPIPSDYADDKYW